MIMTDTSQEAEFLANRLTVSSKSTRWCVTLGSFGKRTVYVVKPEPTPKVFGDKPE